MNFIYRIYYALPNFEQYGLGGKVINKLLEMILKRFFDAFVPAYFKRTQKKQGSGLNYIHREQRYIVSFTSFPARINEVWIAAECMLRQTFKPDMIILWLSKQQFEGEALPENLLSLKSRGLTIEFCDDDLKAHKKYYYAMQAFPNDNIITLDDDLYYDNKTLERVVTLHSQYPNFIAANRAHKIVLTDEGVAKYKKWERRTTDSIPSHLIFSTGGGGTLYPPGTLNDTAFDTSLIKTLCYHADDVWLKVMAILSGKKVATNTYYSKNIISISKTQQEKLVTHNVKSGGNDEQLEKLCAYFEIDLRKYAN